MEEQAYVIISIEGQPEQRMDLSDRMTMGRSKSNTIVVPDQNASRRHAELRSIGGGRYRVFDVGSANGTWLNGRRLTVPKDLEDGDQVVVANLTLHFVSPTVSAGTEPEAVEDASTGGMFATAVAMRNETVVVFVSDIRNYTGMSEKLPSQEFSVLISDWFKACTEIIERNGGTVDKFIGDAVMAYWVCRQSESTTEEVTGALIAAEECMATAKEFSTRLGTSFEGQTFKIGVALNLGEAIFGNVGTSTNQSFTIVGDSVNVAFRLETVTKEKQRPVIVSKNVADQAPERFVFDDLGEVTVKGRKEPVLISALQLDPAVTQ